jgi:hypothetical protein
MSRQVRGFRCDHEVISAYGWSWGRSTTFICSFVKGWKDYASDFWENYPIYFYNLTYAICLIPKRKSYAFDWGTNDAFSGQRKSYPQLQFDRKLSSKALQNPDL